jgi:hypothetical protein
METVVFIAVVVGWCVLANWYMATHTHSGLRRWYRNVHAHDHGGWGDLSPRKGCYCQEEDE